MFDYGIFIFLKWQSENIPIYYLLFSELLYYLVYSFDRTTEVQTKCETFELYEIET